MWCYLLSFTIGIYVGTYFNCKPTIERISKFVKENLPDEKK